MNDGTPPHANYVFVAHNAGRSLLRVGLVASLVGFCVSATLAVSERSSGAMVATGVSAGCLVVFWAVLEARIPQRITIKGPLIQVRRNGHVDTFHLEDPAVDIRVMDGEIAFSAYMDRWVVVRARDVDWHVFTDVVMHYQDKADRDADAKDKRFSS
jgi:hypothetical protein